MDSTRAIIRLWHLCIPSDCGPQEGGDGAIPLQTLKAVLERELEGHLGAFGGKSVDEILTTYMHPDSDGVVGFLQFWRGMEQILQARGSMQSHLTTAQQQAIDGFRFLRTCVLDMGSQQVSQGRSAFSVRELRWFIHRTMSFTGPEGEPFWRRQAAQLPADNVWVTGEEVDSALLAWLEELVDEDRDDEEEEEEDVEDEDCLEEASTALPTPTPTPTLPPPPARAPGSGGNQLLSSSGLLPPSRRRLPATTCSQPSMQSLEAGLTALLRRTEPRPAEPTKEMLAEWRECVEFQVTLSRWLGGAAKEHGEKLAFSDFHRFVRDQVNVASARRRRSAAAASPRPGAASPRQPDKLAARTAAVQVIGAVCHSSSSRRLAEAFGTLRRRPGLRSCKGPRKDLDEPNTIMRELLKSQCQTAVVLETRVKLAGRAGGLAFCLARLQRVALRSAWVELSRNGDEAGPSRDAPVPVLPSPSGALCDPAGRPSLASFLVTPELVARPARLSRA
eukprot:TRINITY_DN36409_c0_g1_i1.p1 TRINITY_DN36409_c0_g1~~TRINITY_DN36409_c0_g1_i1.p1  ORF type:complete len:512 (-),score=94.70 TRINITY_DN36409_c0_g1_i1:31-1542(-)